jgi:glycerate kinase
VSVIVAPDKFKGSLTAVEVAAALTDGLRAARPEIAVDQVPIADGGDGTVDAAVVAGFDRVPVVASGPTGALVTSSYARRGETAVIEMATVCGLLRLPGGRLDPMAASSFGLGEVIAQAVDTGSHRVIIGIGGSASTDGGVGMLQALGAHVTDAGGGSVPRGGAAIGDVARLDLAPVRERLAHVEVVVAADVDNPLVGPNGAAAVYGPQKGADRAQVATLDAALSRWADVVAGVTGRDRRDARGAGAAGGVGFAALAALGAEFQPGIDLMLDLVGFRARLADARLVITGEGALDAQTLAGKAPAGVAAAARDSGVATVAVCGQNTLAAASLAAAGIDAVYALTDLEPDVARCLADARSLLRRVGAAVARDRLS